MSVLVTVMATNPLQDNCSPIQSIPYIRVFTLSETSNGMRFSRYFHKLASLVVSDLY